MLALVAISRDWQRYPLAFVDLNAQVGGGGVVVVVVGCMILAGQRTLYCNIPTMLTPRGILRSFRTWEDKRRFMSLVRCGAADDSVVVLPLSPLSPSQLPPPIKLSFFF